MNRKWNIFKLLYLLSIITQNIIFTRNIFTVPIWYICQPNHFKINLKKAESLYLGQKYSHLVSWMCSITTDICLQGICFFFHSKHSQEGYDVASPKNTSYVTSLDVILLTKKISPLAFTFSIGISCPSFAFSTQIINNMIINDNNDDNNK